ncbi:MAG: hypothetical protein K0R15_216 [Clostridiales bacterium]|jgi:hypothetical protein|nr:hypothetical protein [Clostridiales bacterium]
MEEEVYRMNRRKRSGQKDVKRTVSLIIAVIVSIGMIPAVKTKAELINTYELFPTEYFDSYVNEGATEPTPSNPSNTPSYETNLIEEGDTERFSVRYKFITSIIDGNKVCVKLDDAIVNKAIEIALAEGAKAYVDVTQDAPIGEVDICISVDNNILLHEIELTIPTTALAAIVNSEVKTLKISTPIGNITFEHNILRTIVTEGGKEVTFHIDKVDKLNADLQKVIKDKPIYDLKITSGDKTISQFNGGKVMVSLPYELKSGEKPYNIIIYYINSKNELEVVDNARYDLETKYVTFTTIHFSYFTIAYEVANIGFVDVPIPNWYTNAVYLLAEHRITVGTSATTYDPTKVITRAEFIMMLAKLSGADLNKYSSLHFSDVPATAWYLKASSWGKVNKIILGNDGKFSPTSEIKREEMAVMLTKYLENVAKLKLTYCETSFTDEAEISDYAKTAASKMRQLGIIAGKWNNKFAPQDTLTRAEVAQVIKILLMKELK